MKNEITMATIKSFTDISQSKVLSKILPLESADMYWFRDDTETPKIYPKDMMKDSVSVTLPCWSLAALLSILDFPSLTQNKEDEWEVCVLNHKSDGYINVLADNPVDACVAMIKKLHELKML